MKRTDLEIIDGLIKLRMVQLLAVKEAAESKSTVHGRNEIFFGRAQKPEQIYDIWNAKAEEYINANTQDKIYKAVPLDKRGESHVQDDKRNNTTSCDAQGNNRTTTETSRTH